MRQGNEHGDGGTAGQERERSHRLASPGHWSVAQMMHCREASSVLEAVRWPSACPGTPPWEPKTDPKREGRGAALSHRPDAGQPDFLGTHCPLSARLRQRPALAMVTAPVAPPAGHLTDNISLLTRTLGRRPISLIPILGGETGLAVATSPGSGQAETRTLTGGVLPTARVASVAGGLAAGPSHLSSFCFQGPIGLDGKPVSRPSWASGSSPSLGPGH